MSHHFGKSTKENNDKALTRFSFVHVNDLDCGLVVVEVMDMEQWGEGERMKAETHLCTRRLDNSSLAQRGDACRKGLVYLTGIVARNLWYRIDVNA